MGILSCSGEFNIIDDLTGFKINSKDARKMEGIHEGLVTHKNNWEPEHPQLHLDIATDEDQIPRPAEFIRLRESSNPSAPVTFTDVPITAEALDGEPFFRSAFSLPDPVPECIGITAEDL